MNIENYTANVTELQKEWQKEHQENGLNKFIYDFIVLDVFFIKIPIGIVFLSFCLVILLILLKGFCLSIKKSCNNLHCYKMN